MLKNEADSQLKVLPSTDFGNNFSFRHPYPQNFSLSSPIIKYILKNPTGKAWKKLIQICKYFFSNYPVYPVHHLLCFGGERSSLSGSTPGLWSPNITFNPWEKTIIDFKFAADGEAFDLKDKIANLWIYNELDITMLYDQYYVKKLFSKIVLFNAEIIILYYQYLSWDEYQFLTSTAPIVKRADICHCIIRNSDDSMVTFDKLLETFKDLISFGGIFDASMFNPDTVEKVVKILPRFKNLQSFQLNNIPGTFNFSSFSNFLLKNEKIHVDLNFFTINSETKKDIENFIEQLIENPPKSIPNIRFPGFGGI